MTKPNFYEIHAASRGVTRLHSQNGELIHIEPGLAQVYNLAAMQISAEVSDSFLRQDKNQGTANLDPAYWKLHTCGLGRGPTTHNLILGRERKTPGVERTCYDKMRDIIPVIIE